MDRVRGVEMIMVMKILSICYDIGMKVKPHKVMPSIAEYLGYLFCPANVIFGPWIPFDAYMDMCAHRFVQVNGWEALVVYVLKERGSKLLFYACGNRTVGF